VSIENENLHAAELRAASRLYGSFAALRQVTAEFRSGLCYVVTGENGAGKSTLLRLLAGLIRPSVGTVSVLGGEPQEQRALIGYMGHASMLYDELSARENLAYFGKLYQPPGSCTECARLDETLRAVGLDPALTKPVEQYSQGMKQRVSLARVLLGDPHLLLLDEPFANLDAASSAQMIALLQQFKTWPLPQGAKRTIILTTHQPELAKNLADVYVRMQAARILNTEKAG
jgi:heme ABC exporter ATP-binding subunit CcmA